MAARETFFATCAPGLEALVHGELCALRLARIERQTGGVRFEGRLADAWRANLWLRCAVRVLWRQARFQAGDQDELHRGVQEIDWARFVRPEGTLVVDAQTRESALDHSQFVAQRTKDAIVDQMRARSGTRPSVDKLEPDLRVHVHLWRNRATVSIDTSGESLHKRGWRIHQGRAPLAETLAAALVLLSGWDRRAPLLDPFCGSGTIPIEAGLVAGNVAPGLFRFDSAFGFERLPGHDASAFSRLKAEARAAIAIPPKLRLLGWDRDEARIVQARANAERAGLSERIEFGVGDATSIEPKRGWNAWIVTNPPYGERVGDARELLELYRRFGALLHQRCGGYHVAILSGNPVLARELGLDLGQPTPLWNGAIECQLLRGELASQG
jgi:putative N6-adenine-specific DNA methylase